MRKKIIGYLLVILCVSLSLTMLTVNAASGIDYEFDGNVNYASDAKYWCNDPIPDKTTIDDKGITYKEWGAEQNWAGNSLMSLLPKYNTTEIGFNFNFTTDSPSEYRIVFADCSNSIDGKAIKPWDITGKSEMLSLLIAKGSIALWHNNIGSKSGSDAQLVLIDNLTTYTDGVNHILQITTEPATDGTGIGVKISIDGRKHFDNTIVSEKLFEVNSVLTLGMAFEGKASDTAVISSVKVKNNSDEGKVVIKPYGLLLNANDWTMNEAVTNEVVIDSVNAKATITGFNRGKFGMTYKKALPLEYSLTFNLMGKDMALAENGDSGVRIVVADSEKTKDGSAVAYGTGGEEVFLQVDANDNAWLFHTKNGKIITSPGYAYTGLANGSMNKVEIRATADFEFDCMNYAFYINDIRKGGIDVDGFDLLGEQYLTVGGSNENRNYPSTWEVSNLDVKDTLVEEQLNVVDEMVGADDIVGFTKANGKLVGASGAAWFTTRAVLKNNSEFSFDFKVSDDFVDNYIFVSLSNYAANGWNNDLAEGLGTIHWDSFDTLKYFDSATNNAGTWIGNANSSAKVLNKSIHKITIKTATTDTQYLVTLFIDGKEKVVLDLTGKPLATAEYLTLSLRQTGGAGHSEVSEFYSFTPTSAKVIEFKKQIYQQSRVVTADNYQSAKAFVETARTTYGQLNEYQKGLVTNYGCVNLIENACLKFEAQSIIDDITAIKYDDITTANVQAIKDALANVKEKYAALSEEAKTLVTNYTNVQTIETEIATFEAQLVLKNQAKNIDDAISAIDYSSITVANVQAIKDALASVKVDFEALSAEAKVFVTKKEVMISIESAIAEYEKALTKPTTNKGCKKSQAGASLVFGALLTLSVMKKYFLK